MAREKSINSKQAAKLFSDALPNVEVSKGKPDIAKGWSAFKEFCAIPIERKSEGFIFHAGFDVNFPEGERVVDYMTFKVAFTRYWHEKGAASDTPYLAECSFKIAGNSILRNYEWVDVEVDASDNDPMVRQSKLEKFIKKVEGMAELWAVLQSSSTTEMESYAGPQ